MKDNSSAGGSSLNNMKTGRGGPFLYFYVVKAVFKHCVFSREIWLEYVFVSFGNCSFHDYIDMYPSNSLFGSGYKMTYVFFIRCTIRDGDISIDIMKEVESQTHIAQSNLIHSDIYVRPIEFSAVSPVFHLTVNNSSINGGSIEIAGHPFTAVVIVQITNTVLTNIRVSSLSIDPVAFFIDNCTFIQSPLQPNRFTIVCIVNSRFNVKCQTKGCGLNLKGSGQLVMGITYLTSICDFYKMKMCHGIYLDNDEFIGYGKRSNSVAFSADNLVINNSSISGVQVDISKYTKIIQIRTTILKDTVVRGEDNDIQSYAAYFIDSCTFIQSSLHSPECVIVYIVNSRFNVKCQSKGCALTLTRSNDVDMDTSPINAMCDLFQIKKCYGIYLSNTVFITSKSVAPLLIIEGKQTVVENCTFSMSTSLPIYVTENLIFEVHSEIMKLINVKLNVTKVRSLADIPLFSINTAGLSSQSVLLFCPLSFKVIEKISEKGNNSQFLCQKDVCHNDKYSLKGHSKLTSVANVYNQTKHVLSQLVSSCFPCPVGASCEQGRVVALPNYWGTRKDHVITMFRCPQDYCCQNNDSCSDIDSCNGLRTEILCGNCGPNMTESTFSTNCVDNKTCKPGAIINMYILAVVVYSLGLLSFDVVKDKVLMCCSKVWKKIRNSLFKKSHEQAVENGEEMSQENMETELQETPTKDDSMKYLQILFYYVQDASLFKVHLPQLLVSDDSILIQIFQWSPDIIAKMYLGISNMCFSSTTPITKILFKCLFGPCVIIFLFLIYISQNIMERLCKGQFRFFHFVRLSLLKAFILSVLFSYQQILIGAFSLVQCINIDELKVLYIQGNIHCDQIWQRFIEIYICVNILPLFFIISNASYDVRDMKMSVRTFILTCLFPLPVSIICYLSSKIEKIYNPSKVNTVDNSVMLEETYLESVNLMSLEIEAETELCTSRPDNALDFEDSDIDIGSEYSTDIVTVRKYKSKEYAAENGFKINEHDHVSEAENVLSSRQEVTVAISTIGHDILEGFRDYLK